MAVSNTPQDLIAPLDADWAEKGRENTRRANANDAALKEAVEALQAANPVTRIKVGPTTYTPTAGLVELPQGVVMPPMTTTQRDAIANPTVGQAILNTTTGSPQIYTSSGWQDFRPSAFRTVYTVSATWTKPNLARFLRVVCIGAGGGGGVIKRDGVTYRAQACGGCGGGRAEEWFLASDVPASVSVTVGSGGAGATTTTANTVWVDGSAGGLSSFGTLLQASGGAGGVAGDEPSTRWNAMGPGIARSAAPFVSAYYYLSSSGGGYLGAFLGLLGNKGAGGQSYAVDNNAGQPLGPGGFDGAGAGGSAYNYSSGNPYTSYPSGVGSGVGANDTIDLTTANGSQLAANLTGTSPASKSGTGKAGNGGGVTMSQNTAATGFSVTGGAGGLPGGGGGGATRRDTSTNAAITGGAGARGEVIVDVFF